MILLGRGDGNPAVTAIERLVAREEGEHGAAQRMLVLLHDDEAPQSRTAAWLAPRTIARHLHVRLSRPDEVARVARFIAEPGRGLVLGAGGARGFAHVGVLRALQGKTSIPIDMVGGTSMGAAMAAQHAMGWSRRTDRRDGRQRLEPPASAQEVPRGRCCRSCADGAPGSAAR